MKFEKVTRLILNEPKQKGYNALTSTNELSDRQIYWYPEHVDNIDDYIIRLKEKGYGAPLDKPMILWIHDAILNLREYELSGIVYTR